MACQVFGHDPHPFSLHTFYLNNRKWIHPLLAAILVPLLMLLMDQTYLDKLIEYFDPHFPTLFEPLLTAPFVGLVGYVLYKLDPKAAKNAPTKTP